MFDFNAARKRSELFMSIRRFFTEKDFLTCFSSVFLCLGNLGTGIGGLGSSFTYAIFPDWSLWVFSFLMLAGRLEFYTIYTLFTRAFWKR